MIHEPVDFSASSLKTTTPKPLSALSDELYTNYITAFSDFCNYAEQVIEKIHEIFTLVNENRRSSDCSKFNELADMLREVRENLHEYVEFKKKVKWTFERNSKLFYQQSMGVPSMLKFNAIKLGGYQNFTDFLCRDVEAANALIAYSEQVELVFRVKSCVDCRGTEFFHPVFCSAINFVLSTPNVELNEEYTIYLDSLNTLLSFISSELPLIFKNFARCPKTRKLSLVCITSITEALESLDNYMSLIRSLRNIYDITALFFTTLSKNLIMDDFIAIQIGSHSSRSRFLAFEYDYLQKLNDQYQEVLFSRV